MGSLYQPHSDQQNAVHWQIVDQLSYLSVVWEAATSEIWSQALLRQLTSTTAQLEAKSLEYGCPALTNALILLHSRLASVNIAPTPAQLRAIGKEIELAGRLARPRCPMEPRRLPPFPPNSRRVECPANCPVLRESKLSQLDECLSDTLGIEQIAVTLFAHSQAIFSASGLLLHLVEPDGRRLECVARYGLKEPLQQLWLQLPLDYESPFSDAARSHSTVLLASFNGLTGAYRELGAIARANSHKALVAIPLENQGRLLGVLSLFFPASASVPADSAALQLMARRAAAALDQSLCDAPIA